MSVEAISWALKQPISHSSAKFVLVVMANCADGQDFVAWPSMKYIADATGQDRKTVLANIKKLRELGYIVDTGERKGETGQIVVFQLNSPENGTASSGDNSPENGTVKQSQKRNSTENGTVPFFPSNSPNFPVKESRFSAKQSQKRDTEPLEPLRNRKGTVNINPSPDFDASLYLKNLGVQSDIVGDWLRHRKTKKALPTKTAIDGITSEAAKAGITLTDALRECCQRGWVGFKAEWMKRESGRPNAPNGRSRQSELERRNAEVAAQWIPPELRGEGSVIEGECNAC
ncbi:MAG: helix-turn-helix domain-containing protein [Burkholderiales bacterium]|nr:helix-turn-helix domain-containing protein [Burkholderiales bacterium]